MDTRKGARTLFEFKGTKLTKFYKAVSNVVESHHSLNLSAIVRKRSDGNYEMVVQPKIGSFDTITFYISDMSTYEATLNLIVSFEGQEKYHSHWRVNNHALSHYIAADQVIMRMLHPDAH